MSPIVRLRIVTLALILGLALIAGLAFWVASGA